MNLQLKATNITLNDTTREYINKRVAGFEKLVDPEDTSAICQFEVERTTEHHKSGEIYRAEINVHIAGHDFRSEATKDRLNDAIDEAKNQMVRELRRNKRKNLKDKRRGGQIVKDFLRGLRD